MLLSRPLYAFSVKRERKLRRNHKADIFAVLLCMHGADVDECTNNIHRIYWQYTVES